jgi:hypothetical protein
VTPADFIDSYPVILLDLHYAGQVYRVASEPIDVVDSTGRSLSYAGGLSPVDVAETLGRLSIDAAAPTATVRCVLPIDVAAYRRAGHDLTRATATLWMVPCPAGEARLSTPMVLAADRWPLLTGSIRRPTYAIPDAPPGAVEFTLSAAPWTTSAPIVPADARITSATWPNASFEAAGKRYPRIIGSPGAYSAGGAAVAASGSPAYCIQRNAGTDKAEILLIAGHPVPTAAVTVLDENGDTYAVSPVTTTDGQGRQIAIVDVTAAFPPFTHEDGEFWVSWLLSEPQSGDAVDVLVWALSLTGQPVDVPAFEAIKARVPSVKIATYINDDSTPWEWAQANVLPLLPVTVRRGPDGLYPVVYDSAVRGSAAKAHVQASDSPDYGGAGDWVPVSGVTVQTEPEDLDAATVVRYAYDGQRGGPIGAVSVDSQKGSWYSRAAAIRRGRDISGYPVPAGTTVRAGDGSPDTSPTSAPHELELKAVWDAASAGAVGLWRARAYSLALATRTYEAPWYWGWLQVGDIVTLTDSSIGMASQICTINARAWQQDRWVFEVLLDDDAIRDRRGVL